MNDVDELPTWPDRAATLTQRCRKPAAREMLEHVALFAWLSHCRARGGEYLHAQHYLASAVDDALRMMRRFAAGDEFARINYLMPRRRLGLIAPALARELLAILLGTVAVPEAALLELVERRIRPHAPQLDWREVANVRARMLMSDGATNLPSRAAPSRSP